MSTCTFRSSVFLALTVPTFGREEIEEPQPIGAPGQFLRVQTLDEPVQWTVYKKKHPNQFQTLPEVVECRSSSSARIGNQLDEKDTDASLAGAGPVP